MTGSEERNFSGGFSVSNLAGPMSAACPEPPVAEFGSGRSPGTIENEQLPFAMRLRYYWLNRRYAASMAIGDAVRMGLERPVSK